MAGARVPGPLGGEERSGAVDARLRQRPPAGAETAATLNAAFMDAHWASARGARTGSASTAADRASEIGGMMHVVPVKLLTHMKIYRFGTRRWPDDGLYGGPWWVGVSAYEALTHLAAREARSLREVARERLAILSDWNEIDVLVRAAVRQPLSAWSGTPRTVRAKDAGRYGDAFKADRSITQLYVPGLKEHGPDGRPLWSRALAVLGVDELG